MVDDERSRRDARARPRGHRGSRLRRPDPLASSLRQGPSGIVGVFAEGPLLNSFSDPFAVSVLDGLAQHLGQNSSGILLIPARGSDEHEVVRRMSGIPLDAGVFPLGGHVSAAALDHLRHRRIPLAGMGYPAIDGVLQLTIAERAAMRTLATYLYDLGHRDVAFVEMPQGASRGEGDTTPTANPEGLGTVMYASIRTRTSTRRGRRGSGVWGGRRNA
ncbi:type 1 periplasmic-binding domain-containing protein [Dermacoccus nishinomiyaensis]